jgi:FMN reductase
MTRPLTIVGLGGSLASVSRLISAAGGTQGLQAINTMEFSIRALRAWDVPYVVPVAAAARVFDEHGCVQDPVIEQQLIALGDEVVRVAERFAGDGSAHRSGACDEAAERVAAAH